MLLRSLHMKRNICWSASRYLSSVIHPMSDPVFTTVYSGSRILELSEPEKSNKLSISTLGTLSSLIHKYDDNLVISALFFSSSSPEIFSNGIDDIDIRDNKELLFKEIKKVIEAISRSTKETLAVFDGECDGTAYAIFSSSKYLLGTPSTDIRVTDLSKGRMPLGGLAYRFVKGCDEGVEAARYYALSQASIYGNDAFSLGLVTHLVGESPQHILAHGLSHTIPPSPKSRNIQGSAVDISSLPLLVESMHAECSLDVIDDEIWNEVCLVTPEREREIFSNEENEREDAYTLSKDIHYCFSVNSPEESVLRLHSLLEKHNSSLSSSSSLSLSPWLVIGINTVSRSNSEPYLLQSLAALSSQLPSDPSDLLYNRVLVIIVNMQGTGHTRYDEAKKIYSPPHPLAACFRFIDYSPHLELADPLPGRTEKNDHGTANHPGYRVRKQTRHIVAVLHQALSVTKGSYYMFLEDDMQICAHGLLATQYMISKGSVYHPDWFAIRASYGMNGVVMRWRDLHGFAQYLLKHQTRRPPDHLVVEWYAGETEESKRVKNKRVNIGFRYNFFEHLGKISTLRPQQQSGFPGCYDELLEPTVFEVEAFNLQQCPRDDIWPCNNINKERKKHTVRLDWSVVKKTVAP